MSVYGNNANIDPGNGAVGGAFPPPVGGAFPPPGWGSGARWSGPDRSWTPPAVESEGPVEASPAYEVGVTGVPGEAPVPCNITAGELRDMDDSGSDTDDGFSPEEIDDYNDNDCDPHGADCVDTDCDDSGEVAGNIVRSAVSPIITMPTLGRPGR